MCIVCVCGMCVCVVLCRDVWCVLCVWGVCVCVLCVSVSRALSTLRC